MSGWGCAGSGNSLACYSNVVGFSRVRTTLHGVGLAENPIRSTQLKSCFQFRIMIRLAIEPVVNVFLTSFRLRPISLPQCCFYWLRESRSYSWAASSPFLNFTDHDEELGKLVSEGRKMEFASFFSFSSAEKPGSIPDPQACETFKRS